MAGLEAPLEAGPEAAAAATQGNQTNVCRRWRRFRGPYNPFHRVQVSMSTVRDIILQYMDDECHREGFKEQQVTVPCNIQYAGRCLVHKSWSGYGRTRTHTYTNTHTHTHTRDLQGQITIETQRLHKKQSCWQRQTQTITQYIYLLTMPP